jgi:hypothetical protein
MIASNGGPAVQLDYRTDTVGLLGELTPRRVIWPLWFIIAGGLLCSITAGLTIDAHRHGHDIWRMRPTTAPIGAALILWGVWQLCRLNIDRDHNWMMRGILVVAVLHMFKSIADCLPRPSDPLISLLWVFVGMASLIAAMCLSLCMQWLSQEAGLRRSARNWTWTTVVCGCVFIPEAIINCVILLLATSYAKSAEGAGAQPSTSSSWSWWYLVFLLAPLGPMIGFALSTWLMQREIARKLGRDSGVFIPLSTTISPGE